MCLIFLILYLLYELECQLETQEELEIKGSSWKHKVNWLNCNQFAISTTAWERFGHPSTLKKLSGSTTKVFPESLLVAIFLFSFASFRLITKSNQFPSAPQPNLSTLWGPAFGPVPLGQSPTVDHSSYQAVLVMASHLPQRDSLIRRPLPHSITANAILLPIQGYNNWYIN